MSRAAPERPRHGRADRGRRGHRRARGRLRGGTSTTTARPTTRPVPAVATDVRDRRRPQACGFWRPTRTGAWARRRPRSPRTRATSSRTAACSSHQPRRGVGQEVVVQASGRDPDGALTKTELDLDGDGNYEVSPRTRSTSRARSRSRRPESARCACGSPTRVAPTSTTTTTVDVHATNLAPAANVSASPASPRPGQEVRLNTYGTDPDGAIVRYEFDFDGDGTYEASTGTPPRRRRRSRPPAEAHRRRAGDRRRRYRSMNVGRHHRLQRAAGGLDLPDEQPAHALRAGHQPNSTIAQYTWDLDGDSMFQKRSGPTRAPSPSPRACTATCAPPCVSRTMTARRPRGT